MTFRKGQIYENEYANIFVKAVIGNEVHFIEGISPSAIYSIQILEKQYLEEHINKCNYKRMDSELEKFINC